MATITYEHVTKRFDDVAAVDDLNVAVADGEFLVLVGPSGCGKTTALRMLAGLEDVSEGRILIGDRVVNNVAPGKRNLAMVFQSYALYPHMTVYQNLAFGLENLRTPRATIDAKVRGAAQMLRLDALLERRPTQLSGGQRQRVAIGRAIVRDPTIFLFDEPLSNLDAELRVQMRSEITALHARLGTTMIYVTHDQVEAMTMADRIVVLRAGSVEQIGTPLDLYNRPDNRFVAGFIGSPQMNFLSGRIATIRDEGARIALDAAPHAASDAALPVRVSTATVEQRVLLGIRPEHVTIGAAQAGSLHVTATIDRVEQLGAASFLYCTLSSGERLTVHASGQVGYTGGEQMTVNLPVSDTHLFDATDAETAVALR